MGHGATQLPIDFLSSLFLRPQQRGVTFAGHPQHAKLMQMQRPRPGGSEAATPRTVTIPAAVPGSDCRKAHHSHRVPESPGTTSPTPSCPHCSVNPLPACPEPEISVPGLRETHGHRSVGYQPFAPQMTWPQSQTLSILRRCSPGHACAATPAVCAGEPRPDVGRGHRAGDRDRPRRRPTSVTSSISHGGYLGHLGLPPQDSTDCVA